jgi:RHS repeat-associated protein
VPNAYQNFIYFDKDFGNTIGRKKIIQSEGNIADMGAHGALAHTIACGREGYIYIYLSNQSAGSFVYFDDLTIAHTQSRVIQKNDYYPFGLSIAGLNSSRENALANKSLYNGFELQTELKLGLYDYQARFYDPAIGRFINIDPAADLMRRYKPYNYGFNNPIRFIDPDGMMPQDQVEPENTSVIKTNAVDLHVDKDGVQQVTSQTEKITYFFSSESSKGDSESMLKRIQRQGA